MDPIVFIDSLENISIVNLDVPLLSPELSQIDYEIPPAIPSMHDLLSSLGHQPTTRESSDLINDCQQSIIDDDFDEPTQDDSYNLNSINYSNNNNNLNDKKGEKQIKKSDDHVGYTSHGHQSDYTSHGHQFDDRCHGHQSDYTNHSHQFDHKCHSHQFDHKSQRSRRTISSLDKVRTWKKYAKKKNLSQIELDRKRDLANKQERKRMHRLNSALDRLRQVIPSYLQLPPRRLSKIKTLKLAITYIQMLQNMLQS